MDDKIVLLDYGSGGKRSHNMISEIILQGQHPSGMLTIYRIIHDIINQKRGL